MFTRLVTNIIRKDWFEFRRPIVMFVIGMVVPLLISTRSADFTKGMTAGFGIGAAYAFAYFCFSSERQRGTLALLLSLPVRPSELVLAKYASLYSMVLITANVPTLILRDLTVALLMNVFVIFVATLCMAFTVISDKPWAAVIPMWMVLVFFLPIRKIFERFFPDGLTMLRFLADHMTLWALLALAITPFIAIGSALWFERSHSRN